MSTTATDRTAAASKEARQKPALEKSPDQTDSGKLDGVNQQTLIQPGHMAPQTILRLQRAVGNRAVSKMINSSRHAPSTPAQMSNSAKDASAAENPETQELAGFDQPISAEDALQAKFIQCEAAPDDEELQAKSIDEGGAAETGETFENRLDQMRGSGSPLPDSTRGFMEQRFGANFSGVRLHSGTESTQLNREISAQAFTLGQDIYLGEGKDNVESSEGKHLLAHELTHVVQQNGNAVRRKTSGLRLIQRVSSKPKTSEKILKTLTRNLEKAVRNEGNATPPADAIFQHNPDYYLKLFRYKFEKHKGSDETKLKAYKAVFKIEAIIEAWNQRGQFTDVIEEMCKLIPFIPDNADQMATEDAAFFLHHILMPFKEMSDQASSFLRLLERPVIRNAIKALDNGATWKLFVSDIPQFAVAEGVHEEVEQQGLVLTAEQIVDRLFDAVINNQRIDVGYYTNNLTEDPGPVNILKNATPEEKAARLERYRQDATKPLQPSLQCDNLMKVLQKVVEMYPGLTTTFEIGMEMQALLTVPLNTLHGGLIPNTFQGNVVDVNGDYTNQIFFTGVTDSENPRSHTWNIIGGKPYDSVLGNKGPDVASSIQGSFTQKKTGETWHKVWESGGHTLTQITTQKAAPNHMGFTTAYQRNW